LGAADEFEVSMFLTETSTRHSVLKKHRHFRDKVPARLQSNSSKLLGETSGEPIDVDVAPPPAILREEDSDGEVSLDKIPEAGDAEPGLGKRRRGVSTGDGLSGSEYSDAEEGGQEHGETGSPVTPSTKRARQHYAGLEEDDDEDPDKKKMAMDVSFEGFAIYGRVLCLVVRRRDARPVGRAAGRPPKATADKPTGQAIMENWISSTQVPVGMEDETDSGR
jgi:hypothetical protein